MTARTMPMPCYGCTHERPEDARKIMESDRAYVLEQFEQGGARWTINEKLQSIEERYKECVKCILSDYGRT